MMRILFRTLFCSGLWLVVRTVPAQGTGALYERYRQFAQNGDAAGLYSLADSLEQAGASGYRQLALLSKATGDLRADDLAGCAHWLDSLEVAGVKEGAYALVWAKWKAMVLDRAGEAPKGLTLIDEVLRKEAPGWERQERLDLLIVRAELLMGQGRAEEGLRQLIDVERLAERISYDRGRALSRLNQGNLKFEQGRYPEAAIDYRSALRLASRTGSAVLALNAASNLAAVATMTGDLRLAAMLHDSLITALGDRPSVLKAELLASLGYVYALEGDHSRAARTYDRSLVISKALNDVKSRAKTEQHYAGTLWAMGKKEEALNMLSAALEQARVGKDLRLQAELHWELQERLSGIGRYEQALEHLDTYAWLADSVNEVRFDQRMALAEVQFETERKELRIAEQEQALRIAALENARKAGQRNVLMGIAGVLVILALLLWRGLRIRKRLAEKERELHRQKVDELMHAQEMKAINAMLEGQEKERDRVAKDLHDRLGSMLSAIKFQVGALEERVEKVSHTQDDHYGKVNQLLDDAVGEVRRISHDLIATTLTRFGLAKALEDLCASVRVSGRLSVELRLFGLEHRLERAVEIVVYRIVQELVSNVLKHADAKELSIAVTRETGRLSVMVSDDGRGFDAPIKQPGIGLENVNARATSIGAVVRVDSAQGKGTTVSVECPIIE